MVSRESATTNAHSSDPAPWAIQIDEDHSNMVKFSSGDHLIVILADKMREICGIPELQTTRQTQLTPNHTMGESAASYPAESTTDAVPECSYLPELWDDDAIFASLRAPERDHRLETIDARLGHTFDWAYDDSSTQAGLSKWLQKDSGIFWINGKPASGKSTLMKFLYTDPRRA